jgi:hypothetical protein
LNQRIHLIDEKHDVLSHSQRRDVIHIFTLDHILASDICERIFNDRRLKHCKLARSRERRIDSIIADIDRMARDTVFSRLLIFDVRRMTLPRLRTSYNRIVGYNRKDFNKRCYTILIGDGPGTLFQAGKSLGVFVSHLSAHRVDYHPAVYFYEPFLHYETGEIAPPCIGEEFLLPDKIPSRLTPFFRQEQNLSIDRIRQFFRATGKAKEIRKERLGILKSIYKKRISEQFPRHQDQLKNWLSKEGMRLACEKLHLYPMFFEDWVYDLIRKANKPNQGLVMQNSFCGRDKTESPAL